MPAGPRKINFFRKPKQESIKDWFENTWFIINEDLINPDCCHDCQLKEAGEHLADMENPAIGNNAFTNPNAYLVKTIKDAGYKVYDLSRQDDESEYSIILERSGGKKVQVNFTKDYVKGMTCHCCDVPIDLENVMRSLDDELRRKA